MSYYAAAELLSLGFRECGRDVQISRKASIYNPAEIAIGNHVRVDDFCVLSAGTGGIQICDFIHIAVFSSLIGDGRIELQDFCGLSPRLDLLQQ